MLLWITSPAWEKESLSGALASEVDNFNRYISMAMNAYEIVCGKNPVKLYEGTFTVKHEPHRARS